MNKNTIWNGFVCAKASYGISVQDILEVLQQGSMSPLLYAGGYGTQQIIITAKANSIFIGFRGSVKPSWDWDEFLQSCKDWGSNLLFLPVTGDMPGQAVHAGFYHKMEQMDHKGLADMLLKRKENNIILCGHSAGGAVATLLLPRLLQLLPEKKLQVVTFGAPKTVRDTSQVAAEVRGKITNIVFNKDIVPGVPLFYGVMGGLIFFFHPGVEPEVVESNRPEAAEKFVHGCGAVSPDSLARHSVDAYEGLMKSYTGNLVPDLNNVLSDISRMPPLPNFLPLPVLPVMDKNGLVDVSLLLSYMESEGADVAGIFQALPGRLMATAVIPRQMIVQVGVELGIFLLQRAGLVDASDSLSLAAMEANMGKTIKFCNGCGYLLVLCPTSAERCSNNPRAMVLEEIERRKK